MTARPNPLLDPWFEEQKRSVFDGTARYKVKQDDPEKHQRRPVSLGTCAPKPEYLD